MIGRVFIHALEKGKCVQNRSPVPFRGKFSFVLSPSVKATPSGGRWPP